MGNPRIYKLRVPKEWFEYAIEHGAKYDPTARTFYTLGDIPEPLERFGTEKVEREFLPPRRAPKCPACYAAMHLRTSRQGNTFWGCTNFPKCRAIRQYHPRRLDCYEAILQESGPISHLSETAEKATKADLYTIVEATLKTLGRETFESWLFTPHSKLSGMRPADVMGTRQGILLIWNLLFEFRIDADKERGDSKLPTHSGSKS